jgi:hypothetical protein
MSLPVYRIKEPSCDENCNELRQPLVRATIGDEVFVREYSRDKR